MVAEVLTKEAPLRWHEHEAPESFQEKISVALKTIQSFMNVYVG
jgi:hypothetical protein